VIDELGYVPLSQTGAELLFPGVQPVLRAWLDRLTRHVHMLEMNGVSYWLEQKNTARAANLPDSPPEE